MPTPVSSEVAESPSDWPARAVHNQFASRPTLMSVLAKALHERLLERYPTLDVDPLQVKLATPLSSGGWAFKPLLQVAIDQLLSPSYLDYQPRDSQTFFLTQKLPSRLKIPGALPIDMPVIASLIVELPVTLYIDHQQALANYWSQTDDNGASHWQWLGEFLHNQFKAAALARTRLNETQRQMLSLVAAWPVRAERFSRTGGAVYAWLLETTLYQGDHKVPRLGTEILLARGNDVLLCHVNGHIEAFNSLDDFGRTWAQRMGAAFRAERITWKRYEPDVDLFEVQAGLILNAQLDDLAALKTHSASDLEDLERRVDLLTDPSTLFSTSSPSEPRPADGSLEALESRLPQWLHQASSSDRHAYRRHLLDLAMVAAQSEGRAFNEGLDDIRTFSRNTLRAQMKLDHGATVDYDPDDLELDFAVAAGYPGGAGFIEHVRMSLTDLALKNLAGKPNGRMTVSHKQGQTLPHWLNEDYLLGSTGLIQRVNIGKIYPETIKNLLLTDTTDARRREDLFTRQLRMHLPMRALECKIRGQGGLTSKGYRYIAALMGQTPADRRVDDHDIVLRPLSFHRKSGADPDLVQDMFIIEPKELTIGPHILYRPQYQDALLEYPSRQALFDAIAAPGDLQESVLLWLADRAREVYAYGGFTEPHILNFHAGDAFGLFRKPAPASIAGNEGAQALLQSLDDGRLLSELYGRNARALVDLAERGSVSNSESRWAIMLKGAGLLFNTLLLPLTRGPLMLAGWMLVLIDSLEKDLSALDSSDPQARELALIDLLLNTAMVLMHSHANANTPRRPLSRPALDETTLPLVPWRREPVPAGSMIESNLERGTVAMPHEPVGGGQTTLDFISSTASPKSTHKLLGDLLSFNVPWPDSLPSAETSGPYKGLYRINNVWHASTGGLLFRVNIVPGFGEVYLVNPERADHPGFRLTSDGRGHWRLDRGLRLEGGGPKSRREIKLQEIARQLALINLDKPTLSVQADREFQQISKTFNAVDLTVEQFHEAEKAVGEAWKALQEAQPDKRLSLEKQHEQAVKAFAHIKVVGNIQCEMMTRWTDKLNLTADKLLDISRRSQPLDPHTDHPRQQAELLGRVGTGYLIAMNFSVEVEQPGVTSQGEPIASLMERSSAGLDEGNPLAYQEQVEMLEARLEIMERTTTLATKLERLYQQMETSPAGQAERRRLQALAKYRQLTDRLSAVVMSLDINRVLAMDRSVALTETQARFNERQIREPLISHMSLRVTAGFTSAERQAVLMSSIDRYKQSINLCQEMLDQGISPTRADFQQRYIARLGEVLENAEAELADLIRVDEDLAAKASVQKPQRVPSATKRVFKTRDKGTLVGDSIPAPAGEEGDFIQIQQPGTTEAIAIYHKHPTESVYVEQVIGRPVSPEPLPSAPSRSLASIKRDAQTLMDKRAGLESSILFQQKKLNDPTRLENLDPLDWDNMLIRHAQRLEILASEAGASKDPAAALLNESLRKEVADITRLAREYCAAGYMKQSPNAQKIDYLWRHGFVDINLVTRLKVLASGDYLTEYSIREKNSPDVLWYAHFHYPAIDTPRTAYSFAHLKVPAHRYLTYTDLLRQAAADNRTVIYVKKAVITSPLDEKLFLKL